MNCDKYRVSRNIVYTFILLISQPPKRLEVPSWTFINSPFLVDFKTIKERCQAKFLEGYLNELGLLIGPNKSGSFVNGFIKGFIDKAS